MKILIRKISIKIYKDFINIKKKKNKNIQSSFGTNEKANHISILKPTNKIGKKNRVYEQIYRNFWEAFSRHRIKLKKNSIRPNKKANKNPIRQNVTQ